MDKLLYINNYHCTTEHMDGYPDNHLWGADALSKVYDVTCAKEPKALIPFTFKGSCRGFIEALRRAVDSVK